MTDRSETVLPKDLQGEGNYLARAHRSFSLIEQLESMRRLQSLRDPLGRAFCSTLGDAIDALKATEQAKREVADERCPFTGYSHLTRTDERCDFVAGHHGSHGLKHYVYHPNDDDPGDDVRIGLDGKKYAADDR